MADAKPKKKTPWERVGGYLRKNPRILEKDLFPPALNSSAAVSRFSASGPSSKHSAGTSKVAAQASRFLADVLASQDDVTVHQQRDIDRYLEVIEKQRIHKIQDTDNPEKFVG